MPTILLVILIIVISLVLVLAILYLIICGHLVKTLSHPERFEMDYTYQVDVEKGLIPSHLPYPTKSIVITMRDKTEIHGDLLLHDHPVGVVILAHGYTWTRNGSIKYAQMFYKLGYTCLIYDQRGHGANTTDYCTMGYLEGKDLDDIIYWVQNEFPNLPIGLHGESMGGATVMMALKENPRLQFVIEDCGYSSLYELIKYKLKQMHLIPALFIRTTDWFLKISRGYHLKDVNPAEVVSKSKVPLLIIHGQDDDFVPAYMANVIYEARRDNSQVVMFEKADHALSYETNPIRYEMIVKGFVEKIRKEKENGK